MADMLQSRVHFGAVTIVKFTAGLVKEQNLFNALIDKSSLRLRLP
jgi:hypothetical protein